MIKYFKEYNILVNSVFRVKDSYIYHAIEVNPDHSYKELDVKLNY